MQVNYKVPVCESKEDVIANCHSIASKGFHPFKWADFTTTLDGQEMRIFSQACADNKVWGIFSLTGEAHPEGKNPYRKVFPWVPKEPWTAGNSTSVCEGPKGIIIELIVRIQGYMYPSVEQQRLISRVRAWENTCYFAVANMTGSDLAYSYFGHSNIVDFDGSVLAEAGSDENALTALRDARRNWTAENHLYNLTHRGYTSEPGGLAACPLKFYHTWVKEPEAAKRISELLTRDADDPSAASGTSPAPPPQSALWVGNRKKQVAESNGVLSNGVANGH
eukprot:jgi/Chlat1/7504/Chrsp61S07020